MKWMGVGFIINDTDNESESNDNGNNSISAVTVNNTKHVTELLIDDTI
jgi:hypothetical protein